MLFRALLISAISTAALGAAGDVKDCQSYWGTECANAAQGMYLAVAKSLVIQAALVSGPGTVKLNERRTLPVTGSSTCFDATNQGECDANLCHWCGTADNVCVLKGMKDECTKIPQYQSYLDSVTASGQTLTYGAALKCLAKDVSACSGTCKALSNVPDSFGFRPTPASICIPNTGVAKFATDIITIPTAAKRFFPLDINIQEVCQFAWETPCKNNMQALVVSLGLALRKLAPEPAKGLKKSELPTLPFTDGAKCFLLTDKTTCEATTNAVKCSWCEIQHKCMVSSAPEHCLLMRDIEDQLKLSYEHGTDSMVKDIATCIISTDKDSAVCKVPAKKDVKIPDFYGLRPKTDQLYLPTAFTEKMHADLIAAPKGARNILAMPNTNASTQSGVIMSTAIAMLALINA